MLGIKKKNTGSELIAGVIYKFNVMVDELEKGIDDCFDECDGIKIQMSLLEKRDTNLRSSITLGSNVVRNLKKLVGENIDEKTD